MKIGFFTRKQLNAPERKKTVDAARSYSAESLWALGVRGVRSMNPEARNPAMAPAGAVNPKVYVVGEFPSRADDEEGQPFAGKSSKILHLAIPKKYRDAVRFSYVVRTLPPDGRIPSFTEIECFRPSLIDDIEKTRPEAIIGCGSLAFNWMLGDISSVDRCRGRRFPVRVGNHTCWFYPVMAPSHIAKIREGGGYKDVDGDEWAELFAEDIRRCFRELDTLPEPDVVSDDELDQNVIVESKSVDTIISELERMQSCKSVAFDLETSHLRPYGDDPRILCISLGTESRVLSFPLDHPRASWTEPERRSLHAAVKAFFIGGPLKVAQNLTFDLEWITKMYGWDVLRGSKWGDTLAQRFVLDGGVKDQNLNFICSLLFGLKLKEKTQVDRGDLGSADLHTLLRYNALDSKYTHKAYLIQSKQIKEGGLIDAYREHITRIPTLVGAQIMGVDVDQKTVETMLNEYRREEKRLRAEIAELPNIKQYESRFGSFNPTSPQNVIILFRDVLKSSVGKKGNKYSTDEDTLKKIGGPEAEAILKLRGVTKISSTYVLPLDQRNERNQGQDRSVVWPDGKIHTSYSHARTDTGRLASSEPNLQNFPKRDPEKKKIRKAVKAPKGHLILACDHGQLEARVIAMFSRDKVLCDALWTGYDIHMVWAEKVVKVWPKSCRDRYGSLDKKAMKAFRSDIKNQLVFPAFYGSEMRSMARSLEMDERKFRPLFDEFWHTFSGVHKWQGNMGKFYRRHNYVECLTGRRRYGPLTKNMIINTPVQGTASDIVVWGMNRLSEMAFETGKHWLQPRMNIHDDLTFFLPKKEADEAIETIIRVMCSCDYPWINVPLQVEAEVGKNWYEMVELGKFQSDQL